MGWLGRWVEVVKVMAIETDYVEELRGERVA